MAKRHVSLDVFSNRLKTRLLLAPLDGSADIARLIQRSRTDVDPGQWDLSRVTDWMDLGPEGPRALCVLASAGTGKSTISAVLATLPATAGRIAAHHFVKYSDRRRLDPLRIVKTLAHQLTETVPGVLQVGAKPTLELFCPGKRPNLLSP